MALLAVPYDEPSALTPSQWHSVGQWENSSGMGGSHIHAPSNYLEFLGLEPGQVPRVEMQGRKVTSAGENQDLLFEVMQRNTRTHLAL